MSHACLPSLPWSTSSLGHSPEFSVVERTALVTHVSHCNAMRWQLPGLRGAADRLQGVLAARTITCAMAVGLLAGASWLMV